MAGPLSPSTCFNLVVLLLASATRTLAATVTYDFEVGWVHANPDGAYVRPVIGINGQWPIPTITATKGDNVVIHVKNSLGNQTTSLHFHGLFQNGTTHMDGPPQVTQCEIPIGGSFTYNFTVDQPGTYWYHSHTKGQYPDGLRGPLIIHDPESPFKDQYDEEIVLSFSDWYHSLMNPLMAQFVSVINPTGAEPVPQGALINDTQNLQVKVLPGKTYLFRLVNIGAFAGQYIWFENHVMRIVEVDGVYTKPTEANLLYLTTGQRYSVLVTTKDDASANFAIVGSMDEELFDAIPDDLNSNVTGWLVYDSQKDLPKPKLLDEFEPFDDFDLVPYDEVELLDHVDYSFTLNMKMDNLGDGANYAFFNDVTYVPPKVPSLYTVLTAGGNATNPVVYGSFTNPFVIKKGDVVEIVLNNEDDGKHPFHLHGHVFQTVIRADEEAGDYGASASASLPHTPMRRDTLLVKGNSHFVVRFRADNPGVWLFHCHIEWHVVSGLIATIIEAPLELQSSLHGRIPESHFQACQDTKTPIAGNAAGNTNNFLDLTGQNRSPEPLPAGFTTKGIIAFVISCLSALIGMGFIGRYGTGSIGAERSSNA